jgi:hypothetical protein
MKNPKHVFSGILFFISGICAAQDVNQFTGSLNYGLPLLEVPSNRGQGVSISASYNSGIGMKQAASEIGLGWYLNAGGAITRNVSGINDDCNGCSVWDEKNKAFQTEKGALYDPTHADLYSTSKNMDSLQFMFPDYDDYFVSGPGIGGKMTPYIFNYKLYERSPTSNYKYVLSSSSYTSSSRTPQFHFNGDFADTLVSRHYSVTPISAGTSFKLPTDNIAGLVYNNTTEPYLGKSMNGSSAQNFDVYSNRLGSANYVEYFTNGFIDTYAPWGQVAGFVDYKSSHGRNSTDFPTDGIGAFRITTPSGFVYHYSLPVYVSRSEDHTYPLNNDYSIPSFSETLNSYSATATSYTWSLNGNVVTKKVSENKYAIQWLLTAITGPDFVENGNSYLDDGDTGYWVSFDYQQWSTAFTERSPHYGFDYYFGLHEETKLLPANRTSTLSSPSYKYKLSGKSANVNYSKKDVYSLNKIKTSSHTAIFVKDLRDDEVSSHTTTSYTTAIYPTPQLRTTRVILLKNDRVDSLAAKEDFSWSGNFDPTLTSYASVPFYTEAWYQNNVNSSIKNRILKHAEFTQDYSLCKNYHGNVGVTSLTCNVLTPPATVQSNISSITYSTSGKLTLTKVQIYDLQNVKVSPSYTFDYNQSSSTDNPDYNPQKTDYWGYYKSDVTSSAYSRYTNSTSKDYTDAWCLRKVMQPLGGYIEFDFESNSYKKVLDYKNGYRGASFIYPIKDINSGVNMEESTNPSEFSSLMSGTISGVGKHVCVPFSDPSMTYYLNPLQYIFLIAYGTFTHTGTSSPYSISANKSISTTLNSLSIDCYSGSAEVNDDVGSIGSGFEYSGNGYLMLQSPIGYEVYGGGPRIKRIKNSNNSNETYIQEYTYEDGVASNEADRFEYPVYKASCGGSEFFLTKITPFSGKHSLGTGIGYSKVTVKNLGRANQANGSIVSNYITSYTVNGTPIVPEYTTTIYNNYTSISTPSYAVECIPYMCLGGATQYTTASFSNVERRYYIECFDKFSSYWGLPLENKILDLNNNVISKNTYEYESTEQGAVRENFAFKDIQWASDPELKYTYVYIKHHYPVVLKKTKSYGMGSYTESEALKRDDVTGETVVVRNTGQNGSSSISYKVPAFRISNYSSMGPKSTGGGANVLTPEAYSFASIDTTLLSVANGTCSSFLSANVLTYRSTCPVRTYSGSALPFIIQNSNTNWRSDLSYNWSGTQGSVDSYGLYKRSELTSYPFNFTSPASSNLRWRFVSTTSLYDAVGHALETRSYNNRFNAVRFNHNNDYVSAICANSNYASFTYSGFESIMPSPATNFAEGEMSLPATGYTLVPASTITPHTGYKSIALATGSLTSYRGIFTSSGGVQRGIEPGRMYRAIVWTSTTSPSTSSISAVVSGSVGGVTYSQTYSMTANDANAITVGGWKRLYIDFKVPSDIVASSTTGLVISLSSGTGTGYFDDFMFYPVEGSIKVNVYNPGNGRIVAELNNMGYASLYTYDAAGRILETKQEIPGTGIKLVKRNSYNFARTN